MKCTDRMEHFKLGINHLFNRATDVRVWDDNHSDFPPCRLEDLVNQKSAKRALPDPVGLSPEDPFDLVPRSLKQGGLEEKPRTPACKRKRWAASLASKELPHFQGSPKLIASVGKRVQFFWLKRWELRALVPCGQTLREAGFRSLTPQASAVLAKRFSSRDLIGTVVGWPCFNFMALIKFPQLIWVAFSIQLSENPLPLCGNTRGLQLYSYTRRVCVCIFFN